jgi:hypothetical protein
MTPLDKHQIPDLDNPGFGRDIEMEADRRTDRPAAAELSSCEEKADAEPILGPAPDPDVYLSPETAT